MTDSTKLISKQNKTISAMQGKINQLRAELDKIKSAQPCIYCDNRPDLMAETEVGEICIEQKDTLYVRGFEDYGKCHIRFCPMCGRKL